MGTFDVGVVGAGYVGLATAACLAHVGNRVTLMDADAGRVAGLRRGELPIFEPDLEELLRREAARIGFTTELAAVVPESGVVFIAAGTPERAAKPSAALSGVGSVARGIGRALAGRSGPSTCAGPLP